MITVLLITACIIFFLLGRGYQFNVDNKKIHLENALIYQKKLFEMCREENRKNGRDVNAFFVNNGIKRIVIYGMGYYYNLFKEDIREDEFEAVYLADKNYAQLAKELGRHVYSPQEMKELDFDAVIVTPLPYFQEIARELRKQGLEKKIISYGDLVFNARKEF